MRWDAKMYDSVKAPQVDAGRKLVGMAKITGEESVLDLGCGTGILTEELASQARWGEVVALDPSREMLAQAQQRLGGYANVSLVQNEACLMEYADVFDVVFSNSVLQWVPEQEKALRCVYRALKPGGRAAIQIAEKDFFPEFGRYFREAREELALERYFEGWRQDWYMPTQQEYEALLQKAGFAGPEVSLWEQTCVFSSVNDVLDWLSSTGLRPYLARLPQREQERFRYAFAMRFENNRTPEGIVVTMRRLLVQAQKRAGSERALRRQQNMKKRAEGERHG